MIIITKNKNNLRCDDAEIEESVLISFDAHCHLHATCYCLRIDVVL